MKSSYFEYSYDGYKLLQAQYNNITYRWQYDTYSATLHLREISASSKLSLIRARRTVRSNEQTCTRRKTRSTGAELAGGLWTQNKFEQRPKFCKVQVAPAPQRMKKEQLLVGNEAATVPSRTATGVHWSQRKLKVNSEVRQDFGIEFLAKAKPLRLKPRPKSSPAYCKAKTNAKD